MDHRTNSKKKEIKQIKVSDDLKNIYFGWKNYIVPNKEIEKIANKRLKICYECKHFTLRGRCKKCGCFMNAKTRAKKAKCPLKYW